MGAFWYLLTDFRTSEKADYEHNPELFVASVLVLILGAIIVPLIERIGDKKDKDKDEDRKERK